MYKNEKMEKERLLQLDIKNAVPIKIHSWIWLKSDIKLLHVEEIAL